MCVYLGVSLNGVAYTAAFYALLPLYGHTLPRLSCTIFMHRNLKRGTLCPSKFSMGKVLNWIPDTCRLHVTMYRYLGHVLYMALAH